MSEKIFDIRAFHQPLAEAGLVPKQCRLMSIAIGVNGPCVITYEVFLTAEQSVKLGEVFISLGQSVK